MDWLAQLLGLPRGLARAHRGHRVDLDRRRARCRAVAAARRRRLRVGARRTSASRRPRASSGSSSGKVEVDDVFRMRTDFPLDDATAVVATVGTTGTTSVDPVPELARRCEEAGVWLHVDAAYAGPPPSVPSCAGVSTACDRVDSIVVNPHKWLFTPMDCSAFWTRRPEVLQATFASSPDYLASTGDAVDLKDFGPALGRRFRALKLWLVLRMYGAEGLRAGIREHVRLAAALRVVGRGRARLGGGRPAPVLDGLLPPRRPRQLRARACGDRDRRAVRRRDAAPRPGRDPARDRQRRHDRGRRAALLGGARRSAGGDLRPLGDADRLGPGGCRAHGRRGSTRSPGPASATGGTGSRTATSHRCGRCSPRRACRPT